MTTAGSGVALSGRSITKSFGGIAALRGVDVEFRSGEVHGLIGPNGSGKSTLLSILSGAVAPDQGTIVRDAQRLARLKNPRAAAAAGIERMPQELALVPALTVAENIVLGAECSRLGVVSSRRRRASAETAMAAVGFDVSPHLTVRELRPSQQRLVMLARTLHRGAEVIIADEPTAGLLPEDARHVADALGEAARSGRAVIFVSHHLEEVARLAHRVTVLRDGQVVTRYDVPATRDELLSEMLGGVETVDTSSGERPPAGEVLLEATDLVAETVRGVDLAVRRHEIVGVAGLLGSGRDDLLPALVGHLPRQGGRVVSASRSVDSPLSALRSHIGYLSGDRTRSVFPRTSITHHVTMPSLPRFRRAGALAGARERESAGRALTRVGVVGEQGAPLTNLSGGNQQRALLARWFVAGSDLLLVDEPAVGVDVAARAALLEELATFAQDGAVLLASSDPDDLFAICDRVVCFRDGIIVNQVARGAGWRDEVGRSIA